MSVGTLLTQCQQLLQFYPRKVILIYNILLTIVFVVDQIGTIFVRVDPIKSYCTDSGTTLQNLNNDQRFTHMQNLNNYANLLHSPL